MAKAIVLDGHVRQITVDDVKPGVVLREVSRKAGYADGGTIPPFAYPAVLKVDPDPSCI